MHVPDEVERSVVIASIVPKRLAGDRGRIHFFPAGKGEHVSETLLAQPAQGSVKLRALLADDVRAEFALGPILVALVANGLG